MKEAPAKANGSQVQAVNCVFSQERHVIAEKIESGA